MNHRHLQTQIFSELARELARASARERGTSGRTLLQEIFDDYAAKYGVRPNTFRKWQRAQHGTRRADAGAMRKAAVMEPIIREIFAIQTGSSDFEAERWLSSAQALKEAVRRGIIQSEQRTGAEILHCVQDDTFIAADPSDVNVFRMTALSVRNYNLWVQKLGLRKQRGFTRFQAEWSNQVHQMDVSGSAYLEVVQDLGDGDYLLKRRTPRSRLSKKQRAEGLRLWMAGVVDDYSGVMAIQYTVARGESAAWVRLFLDQVWRGLDPALPLRGLPDVLYCDNGPFAKAEETAPYLSAEMGVGVTLQTHEPYRSRSTGKMERQWRTVKSGFETPFLSGRDEWLLSEVNGMMTGYCCEASEKQHRNLPLSRAEAFLKGIQGTLRLPSDDALRAAFRTEIRVVDGSGVFRLENIFYRLPAEMRSQRVLVFKNGKSEVVAECPATGQRATAEIYGGPNAFGEFESFAETERERVANKRDPRKKIGPDGVEYTPAADWGTNQHPYEQRTGAEILPEYRQDDRSKVVPFVPADTQPAKESPFTVAARFGSVLEARSWLAGGKGLGIGLLTFKRDYPQLWAELTELLERTLDREEISEWANRVRGEWGREQSHGGGR